MSYACEFFYEIIVLLLKFILFEYGKN